LLGTKGYVVVVVVVVVSALGKKASGKCTRTNLGE
jgi:hypothetical protein